MKLTRKQAREIALCLVFDFGFNCREKPEELLELYIHYFPDADDKEQLELTNQIKDDSYISRVYFGVTEKISEIDDRINNLSLKWKLQRISRVSMSILRIAVYELLYMQDIPQEVSINEAVEMAKKFDTDDSYTFINGVLGAFVKELANKDAEKSEGLQGDNE